MLLLLSCPLSNSTSAKVWNCFTLRVWECRRCHLCNYPPAFVAVDQSLDSKTLHRGDQFYFIIFFFFTSHPFMAKAMQKRTRDAHLTFHSNSWALISSEVDFLSCKRKSQEMLNHLPGLETPPASSSVASQNSFLAAIKWFKFLFFVAVVFLFNECNGDLYGAELPFGSVTFASFLHIACVVHIACDRFRSPWCN